MQDQMKVVIEKMKQSNDQIASFQTEVKSLKEEKKADYRAAVGHVTPGRIVIPPSKHQPKLGIRAWDIPESHASTADERMLDNIAALTYSWSSWTLKTES